MHILWFPFIPLWDTFVTSSSSSSSCWLSYALQTLARANPFFTAFSTSWGTYLNKIISSHQHAELVNQLRLNYSCRRSIHFTTEFPAHCTCVTASRISQTMLIMKPRRRFRFWQQASLVYGGEVIYSDVPTRPAFRAVLPCLQIATFNLHLFFF